MPIVPGYYWYSKAAYGGVPLPDGAIDEVMFGMYDRTGGGTGEMSMRWIELGGEPTATLCAFVDAWHLFGRSDFAGVLEDLSHRRPSASLSPDQFVAILDLHGFEDLTPQAPAHGQR